jgi:hypothetical protein
MGTYNEFRKNQIYIYIYIYIYIGEGKGILKFVSGKYIKPITECTYLSVKIDQTGYITTEI